MASWNDFFGTSSYDNNYYYYDITNRPRVPEWMNEQTPAAQVIPYPPHHHESNYAVYSSAPNPYELNYAEYSSSPVPHESNYAVYSSSPDPRAAQDITMVLNVPICCEGCEERVKDKLIDIDGVQGVSCDQARQRVTVTGTASCSPAEVLKACKKLFKRSHWAPH